MCKGIQEDKIWDHNMEGQGEIVSDTGTTTKGPRAHRKVGS